MRDLSWIKPQISTGLTKKFGRVAQSSGRWPVVRTVRAPAAAAFHHGDTLAAPMPWQEELLDATGHKMWLTGEPFEMLAHYGVDDRNSPSGVAQRDAGGTAGKCRAAA
jgi:hypothetical protein